MSHSKLKGGLSISRPSGNIGPDYIEIRVVDELSGSQFVSVRVPLAGFAEAVTGRGHVDCEFDFRPELVGLKREHKEEFVPYDDLSYYARHGDRDEVAAEAFAPFEIDGWKGRADDLFNHHRRGKDGSRVTFIRYVPIENTAEDRKEL